MAHTKVTREEIETLCLLHAVGPHGCPVGELAARLGLSATLAPAVTESIAPLIGTGRLAMTDNIVTRTATGDHWLTQRLSELGLE